ncbi:hypothetical protein O181_012556 [Austropuccinia psidii MF-1]|uniref:Uncharacterized protein n=1 Tax=Austropuccinia psidii MF-1 TaxID=1389203 RepID=A0A9Q3GMF1_9BASI|nr:hypothetical protein [Austropuccinia psidii MF-1]
MVKSWKTPTSNITQKPIIKTFSNTRNLKEGGENVKKCHIGSSTTDLTNRCSKKVRINEIDNGTKEDTYYQEDKEEESNFNESKEIDLIKVDHDNIDIYF